MIYDLQKASILKRISAWLLDFILCVILITGFATLFSHITDIDSSYKLYDELMTEYEVKYSQNEWNMAVDFEKLEYDKLTKEQQEFINNAHQEIRNDKQYIYYCDLIFNKTLTIVSLSLFFGIFVTEFLIPLWLKNGQTIGKKIFAIGVMRIDGVKINPVILFVRSILGKYTIETMIPAFILLMHHFGVGTFVTLAVLILIPIFELALIIFTHNNSLIHDTLSSTVTVDFQSQMIFDSVEAMNEYKLRIHAEDVKKAKY